ncbi:MAG: hypothetical protein AAFP69_20415, partial [Planctomycetota bacterium]
MNDVFTIVKSGDRRENIRRHGGLDLQPAFGEFFAFSMFVHIRLMRRGFVCSRMPNKPDEQSYRPSQALSVKSCHPMVFLDFLLTIP